MAASGVMRRGGLVLLSVFVGSSCSRTPPAAPPPTPRPVEAAATPAAAPVRLLLPARIPNTTWRVMMDTQLRLNGAAGTRDEGRTDSQALVSWQFERTADGALRGSGLVDSFQVRAVLAASGSGTRGENAPARVPKLLLDLVVDSLTARVVTRPPLVNECDRPEAAAAALARSVVVRIPDGVQIGSRWRDSTVTLVCRSGVPLVVHQISTTRVESLDDVRIVLQRESVMRLSGTGGAAFRALSVTGMGTGRAQLRLRRPDGVLESLTEHTTATLQLTETGPSASPRVQRVDQQTTTRAERILRP